MSISFVAAASYIPPTQASDELQRDLSAPAPFHRPNITLTPRSDVRLQPWQLVLGSLKSAALKKLFEDANDGATDKSEQLATLEKHLRAGGRLITLLKPGSPLQSSLLFMLASDLAVSAKSTDAAFAGQLEAEISSLLSSNGEEINAAINSARSFAESGADIADRRWLRAGYLAVVSSQGSISELLESLLLRFGPIGFHAGAIVLLKGLNDDLTSASPSMRPGKLHILLLSSLVALRHLSAFIRAVKAFTLAHKAFDTSAFANGSNEARTQQETANLWLLPDSEEKKKRKLPRLDDALLEEEALIAKTFLQLIAGQGSITLIQKHLQEHFCSELSKDRQEKVFKDFIAFIQSLPLALWRERGHKDKLVEALRRQLLLDQLVRNAAG